MADITELAQSLKAAAEKATQGQWIVESQDCRWNVTDAEGVQVALAQQRTATRDDPKQADRTANAEFIAMANPANVLDLVEALEKAQAINAAAEKLVRCKGRYHSEQNYRALAAMFGVTTPDLPSLEHENVHYVDAAEMEIAALRQRIAELESRTVKLPDLRQIVSGDRYAWSDGVYNYSQDAKVALADAGIKVEAE